MDHLIAEIRYLGPVFLHHMYPYERFMSTLNKYTKSRVHPEGSMVQGYSVEEVVDWCLDFIDPTNPIGISKARHEGRLAGMGILGEKTLNPDVDAFRQAHFLVLQHTTEVSPYIDEHKVQLRRQYPDRSEAWLARAHMKGFNIWFRDRIQKSDTCTGDALRSLAVRPLFTITSYQAYDIWLHILYHRPRQEKHIPK